MNNAVKIYTFLIIVFILLFSASASFGAPFNILLELVAYAVPIFVGYLASRKFKREREEVAGVAEAESTLMGVSPKKLLALSPVVMPTLAVIFLISYLTSLVLGVLGLSGTTVEDAPIIEMILIHALVPAITEEMLFRYIPMKLIAPYSKRICAVISSAYFALIHMNLFQLPYALLAGAIFIVIDLYADSVLPSLVLHILNNTVSILWIKYSASGEYVIGFVITLVALALLSLIPIILKRREYLRSLREALRSGETLTDRYAPTLFIAFTLIMTLMNHL